MLPMNTLQELNYADIGIHGSQTLPALAYVAIAGGAAFLVLPGAAHLISGYTRVWTADRTGRVIARAAAPMVARCGTANRDSAASHSRRYRVRYQTNWTLIEDYRRVYVFNS